MQIWNDYILVCNQHLFIWKFLAINEERRRERRNILQLLNSLRKDRQNWGTNGDSTREATETRFVVYLCNPGMFQTEHGSNHYFVSFSCLSSINTMIIVIIIIIILNTLFCNPVVITKTNGLGHDRSCTNTTTVVVNILNIHCVMDIYYK